MQIHLHTGDGAPIYLQIVQQVRYQIASGRLAPGEELPPIRALAEQLVINPNTVARAYRDLERQGLLVKRSTTGTFVSTSPDVLACRTGLAGLTALADGLLAAAADNALGIDELVELLRQRHRERTGTKESPP
jgi:DNA-binding transcriptional regulator YhcF (GntR family)